MRTLTGAPATMPIQTPPFDFGAWAAACDRASDAGEVRARLSDRWYTYLTAKLRAEGGRGAARAERRFQRVCAEKRIAEARSHAAMLEAAALAPICRLVA